MACLVAGPYLRAMCVKGLLNSLLERSKGFSSCCLVEVLDTLEEACLV